MIITNYRERRDYSALNPHPEIGLEWKFRFFTLLIGNTVFLDSLMKKLTAVICKYELWLEQQKKTENEKKINDFFFCHLHQLAIEYFLNRRKHYFQSPSTKYNETCVLTIIKWLCPSKEQHSILKKIMERENIKDGRY